jgi:glycosyltransferase involved in cell wall biosynthesis
MNKDDPAHAAPRPEVIPPGTPRPLWSVMIPTFNCAHLLRHTLESVLAQDPGPELMQIEVIDDCSTKDDPEEVVRKIGQGRVTFHRKASNEGAICNFNTCIARSRGHLVHILHGDDLVCPGFYRRVGQLAEAHPDMAGYFVRCFEIDEDGEIVTLLYRAKETEKPTRDVGDLPYLNIYQTPGAVIRRSFYELHGGFLPSLVHVADWEMWLRVIAEGGAVSLNEPLALYRIFKGNDSSRLMRTGENIRDMLRFGRIVEERISNFDRQRFLRVLSEAVLAQARNADRKGDHEAAKANWNLWHEITPWTRRMRRHSSLFVQDAFKRNS